MAGVLVMSLKFILIGIILIVFVIFIAIRFIAYHFECPNCDEHFHIGLLQYLFASGVFLGKRKNTTLFGPIEVTCPKCEAVNRLMPKKGKN